MPTGRKFNSKVSSWLSADHNREAVKRPLMTLSGDSSSRARLDPRLQRYNLPNRTTDPWDLKNWDERRGGKLDPNCTNAREDHNDNA